MAKLERHEPRRILPQKCHICGCELATWKLTFKCQNYELMVCDEHKAELQTLFQKSKQENAQHGN